MEIFSSFVFAFAWLGGICLGMSNEDTNLDVAQNRTVLHQERFKVEAVEDRSQNSVCPACLKPQTLVFSCIFLLIVSIPFVALFVVKHYYAKQKEQFPYKRYENESEF